MAIQPIQAQGAINQPHNGPIQPIANPIVAQDQLVSSAPKDNSCLQKIKDWFTRTWNAFAQAFKTCFCSKKGETAPQIPTPRIEQPVTGTNVIAPQVANPRIEEPIPRIGEPVPGPLPERDALIEQLGAPFRQVRNEPYDQTMAAAVNLFVARAPELARRAALGIASYMWADGSADLYAQQILAPAYHLADPAARRREGITDQDFEQLLHVARALVQAPMPTLELRQAFLITFIETRFRWRLENIRAEGNLAALQNNFNVARACLNMANALDAGDPATIDREAQVLAEIGNRFRNPHNIGNRFRNPQPGE